MRYLLTMLLVVLGALPARAGKAEDEVPRGGLVIKTRPAGAKVFFDGKPLRKHTPVTIRHKPEGSHRVKLLRGKLVLKTRIAIYAGEVRQVTIDLRDPTGELNVVTDPRAAEVLLDGAPAGQTPVILEDVPFGLHRLRLDKPGYEPLEIEISVRSPDRARVAVHMREQDAGPEVADEGGGAAPDGGDEARGDEGAASAAGDEVIEATPEGQPAGPLAAAPADEPPPGSDAAGVDVGRVFQWTLLGVGVALLGGGVAFEVFAAQAADATDSERAVYHQQTNALDALHHYNNAEHNRQVARQNEVVAGVMFGAGAAAVAGSVLWLVLDRDREPAAPPPAAVVPVDRGAALMLGGRW